MLKLKSQLAGGDTLKKLRYKSQIFGGGLAANPPSVKLHAVHPESKI